MRGVSNADERAEIDRLGCHEDRQGTDSHKDAGTGYTQQQHTYHPGKHGGHPGEDEHRDSLPNQADPEDIDFAPAPSAPLSGGKPSTTPTP